VNVSDKKVKDAILRIKARRKEGWLQHMLTEVEKIDANINNLHKTGDNLDKIDAVFKELEDKFDKSKSGNKDNKELYKEMYASMTESIKEHMTILTSHAKEKLAEEMENEDDA